MTEHGDKINCLAIFGVEVILESTSSPGLFRRQVPTTISISVFSAQLQK